MNPVMDQERTEFLATRMAGARKQLLPQWMRPDKELPVIALPIEWVRFSILNHRTRAEQLREIEASGNPDLFSGDPLGAAAQQAQLKILAGQESFDLLKQDLRERGQQEPAIVTAEGVLINGNRRAVGLRELWLNDHEEKGRYIRTFVLPADTAADELIDLETELQVAKDFRKDYSWVNEALLVEEIFDTSGKSWDVVAKRMRLEQSEARTQYDKLQQLRQLVAVSNGTRHLADFVGNESAFDELAKHIKDKPLAEAEAVRSVYFLGTLTGVKYRDLRHLRRKDAPAFVSAEFSADPTLTSLLTVAEQDAGDPLQDLLDDVLGESKDPGVTDLSPILSFLARRKPEDMVEMPGGAKVAVEQLMSTVSDAVTAAAKEASEEAKDEKAVGTPTARLKSAGADIDRARLALAKARSHSGWDEAAYKVALDKVKGAIAAMEALG